MYASEISFIDEAPIRMFRVHTSNQKTAYSWMVQSCELAEELKVNIICRVIVLDTEECLVEQYS